MEQSIAPLRTIMRLVSSISFLLTGELNFLLVVGKAVAGSQIPRSELFLTSKYMPAHSPHPHDKIIKTIRDTVKKMDQMSPEPYVDLLLTHAPWGGDKGRAKVWAAMNEMKEQGLVKDVGVSN
jgi:diketogulonate reductase-like aldo/keto reductase